ncbi:MAG: flagellin [bacterium]
MILGIASNDMSNRALRYLSMTTNHMSKSMEKLSSGYKINSAADGAAELVNSKKLESQIAGESQAINNIEIGSAMLQTAEAALDEIQNLSIELRGLALSSANDAANDSTMMSANDTQAVEIVNTIDRIATTTQFSTKYLLRGDFIDSGNPVTVNFDYAPSATTTRYSTDTTITSTKAVFQIGANAGQTIAISIAAMTANNLGDATTGYLNTVRLNTAANANTAIGIISIALQDVSDLRAMLGAYANNLESTKNNTIVARENLEQADGVIRNTDMAREMSNFTLRQIQLQAVTAMAAQANMIPQSLLQLLS